MKIQIIFANGRTMHLDDIKTYTSYGDYWEIVNNNGDSSYIEGEILYIGQPEYKQEFNSITIEAVPARRKPFKL